MCQDRAQNASQEYQASSVKTELGHSGCCIDRQDPPGCLSCEQLTAPFSINRGIQSIQPPSSSTATRTRDEDSKIHLPDPARHAAALNELPAPLEINHSRQVLHTLIRYAYVTPAIVRPTALVSSPKSGRHSFRAQYNQITAA
jgi:hypothetical protein